VPKSAAPKHASRSALAALAAKRKPWGLETAGGSFIKEGVNRSSARRASPLNDFLPTAVGVDIVQDAVKREEARADEAERRSEARAEAAERRADAAILKAIAREERADSRVEAAERRAAATIVTSAARADEAEHRADARVEAAERRADEAEAKAAKFLERLLEAKKEEGKFEALKDMPQIRNLPQFLCEFWPMWQDQLRRNPGTPRLLTPATPRPVVLSVGQQDGVTSLPPSASGDVSMEQDTTATGDSRESLAGRDAQQN
jgi:hypothetical protein